MMRTSVGSSFAIALCLSTVAASAQSRLGKAADSLEDSLKALAKQFERRGDQFQDSAGSLFHALDKARDDSDRLGKAAGSNYPKSQLQTSYQELRAHINDLAQEIRRYSLTDGEKRAAEVVWWNNSLTASAWERYGVTLKPSRPPAQVVPVIPVVPPGRFTPVERARTYASRYLTDKYRVPARDLNIGKATEQGRIVRVKVAVKGVGTRVVDVDPRSGTILGDRRD